MGPILSLPHLSLLLHLSIVQHRHTPTMKLGQNEMVAYCSSLNPGVLVLHDDPRFVVALLLMVASE